MTKIEEIARALCEASGGKWDAAHFNETLNGDDPEEQRAYFMMLANAALPPLREPTPGMCKAGDDACDYDALTNSDVLREIGVRFTAMIDHLIQEGKK